MSTTFNWTQPLCLQCWADQEGDRVPQRLAESIREKEVCCNCGEVTWSGIYVRVNPEEAKHPTRTNGD